MALDDPKIAFGLPTRNGPIFGPIFGPNWLPVLKKKVGHGKMKQRGFHRLALEIYQLMGQTTSTHFVAIQPSKDVKVHGRTGNHSLFFCFVDFASRNTQRLCIWRTQPGCMAGKMHHVQVIEGSCTRCPGPTETGEKDLNTRFPPNIKKIWLMKLGRIANNNPIEL